jgi:transcriptional regulator with XRE-family HTH domain
MGYGGKVKERERARELRAQAWTLAEIAEELGVSKSSASVWVRDVEFTVPPRPRRQGRRAKRQRPGTLQAKKQEEIERLLAEGRERIGRLSERDFLIAGAALYAGEGAKTDGAVAFSNSDPRFVYFFAEWLRHFFGVDETRLRMHLYLHEGLCLEDSVAYWSNITRIPTEQFGKPYRAAPDPSIRRAKHPHGCVRIKYSCSRTHRAIMGLVHGLLDPAALGHPDVEFDTNGCRIPPTGVGMDGPGYTAVSDPG